jgi:NAD(P)-dependent dehydrogenase (short-subunit alcohol dehydrogenase family)
MFDRAFDYSGKTVLITGAGTGLGRAMSLALADCGADIVGAARRLEPLQETKAMVEETGRKCLVSTCDVRDSGQVNDMISNAIKAFGRIDILINNAGVGEAGRGKTLLELTDEEWHSGIDTNLSSAFYCSRAMIPHFLENGGGRIINLTSGWGYRARRDLYMYSIAKGGIIQLTKCLAVSYARDNIYVTCIAPGSVPTQITEDEIPAAAANQPMGRVGVGGDISSAAVFLCSDFSNYMTGETILVDGGAIAGGLTPAGIEPRAEG